MKYQETGVGQKADFAEFVKKVIPELFGGRFAVEGKTVTLPSDTELEYKTKYDVEEQSGSFSIKVSWDYATDEEDVEVETD
jgi:amphi-Trp domain-containing protein